MVLPAIAAAAIPAIASIVGGYISRPRKQKPTPETPIQSQQRNIIDQLMQSLQGQGPYSGLFDRDEATFQKSYVDPALSMFKNQWAPQIQQSFLASGMHKSSGMEDALTRAGVDMEQMLASQYGQYKDQGDMNMMNVINSILGAGPGYQQPPTTGGGEFMQSVGGYLGSPAAKTALESILDSFNNPRKAASPAPPGRSSAGFSQGAYNTVGRGYAR